MTAMHDGASRACKVVIDELEEAPRLNANDKPACNVVGYVEAEVGPRDDGAAKAKRVRATFAGFLFDSSQ